MTLHGDSINLFEKPAISLELFMASTWRKGAVILAGNSLFRCPIVSCTGTVVTSDNISKGTTLSCAPKVILLIWSM